MPVKIIHPDHVEILGLGHVLLTAPHAANHEADLHTGSIVEEAALTSRSFAVIGKVRAEFLDLNRVQSARTEFRKSIDGFIAEDGIRYLLNIHGKKAPGVDIGTTAGEACSESTIEVVRSRLVNDFTVRVNNEDEGIEPGSITTSYGGKDAKGDFIVETIQVRFGHEERQFQREKVIRDVSEIADILNARLAASRGD
jgi:hypothetical protein